MGENNKMGDCRFGQHCPKVCHGFKACFSGGIDWCGLHQPRSCKGFQKEFNVQKSYDNYDDLYHDPDIEVIYIASLNQNHKSMTIEALKARKGVLCEKPWDSI